MGMPTGNIIDDLIYWHSFIVFIYHISIITIYGYGSRRCICIVFTCCVVSGYQCASRAQRPTLLQKPAMCLVNVYCYDIRPNGSSSSDTHNKLIGITNISHSVRGPQCKYIERETVGALYWSQNSITSSLHPRSAHHQHHHHHQISHLAKITAIHRRSH